MKLKIKKSAHMIELLPTVMVGWKPLFFAIGWLRWYIEVISLEQK